MGFMDALGQKASGVIGSLKDKWKAMPRDQKIETITTLGTVAAAAFAKPKKRPMIGEAPELPIGGNAPLGGGSSRAPDFPSFSSAPLIRAEESSKFAKKMRKNFGQ